MYDIECTRHSYATKRAGILQKINLIIRHSYVIYVACIFLNLSSPMVGTEGNNVRDGVQSHASTPQGTQPIVVVLVAVFIVIRHFLIVFYFYLL